MGLKGKIQLSPQCGHIVESFFKITLGPMGTGYTSEHEKMKAQ
jgi:hypothetical protein